ncbi:MAG: adenylate kinase [Gaiellaceae bacterium]|jgi:adenylate kinase|nr:adenylate kinase [Gaiellaceae bacterium]MDX6468517.1 adenylate kinase [Gaiellaceae bacterium]MDX6473426.1 adenylate kinase [Gaiellaceae bacterium]
MNILLLGPQGSGKGTQAKKISEAYDIPHLSTGDLYRAAIAAGTELGTSVAPLLAAGQLVPDEITIPLIREKVLEAESGFVLDGYPRNLAQAEALDELLDEIGRPLSTIVLLELSDDIARERLAKRAELEGRADDRPEAIERRLRNYHEQTEPVVDHYLATGKLVKMHAERPIDEVWAEIEDTLEQAKARA